LSKCSRSWDSHESFASCMSFPDISTAFVSICRWVHIIHLVRVLRYSGLSTTT
jgi:hypothetical protein